VFFFFFLFMGANGIDLFFFFFAIVGYCTVTLKYPAANSYFCFGFLIHKYVYSTCHKISR